MISYNIFITIENLNVTNVLIFSNEDMGPVDPARDIETLNEDESEYVEDSECDQSEQPLSLGFANDTASSIGVLDSGSEDYRFNTGIYDAN